MQPELNIDLMDAPCDCFMTDESGVIVFCNQKLCADLNYNSGEIVGKKIDFLLPLSSRIFYQTHISPMLRLQGEALEIFLPIQNGKKESKPFVWNIKTNNAGEVKTFVFAGLLMVNRSRFENELVNARKAAENDLRQDTQLISAKLTAEKQNQLLEFQSKLNAQQAFDLEQYTRILSHDLREPIRKISMFSSMLDARGADSSENQQLLLGKITREAQVISALADNLQAFSFFNAAPFNPEWINLRSAIDAGAGRCTDNFPDLDIKVVVNGTVDVFADRKQLELLFEYLILTAVNFRNNQQVNIAVDYDQIKRNAYRKSSAQYQFIEMARIRIFSTDFSFGGRNILQFEELFKVIKAGNESSFHLSLVKKIIDQLNGQIEFTSTSGKEGTFVLYLPLGEKEIFDIR